MAKFVFTSNASKAMKKSPRSLFVKVSLFAGLLVILYLLIGSILIVHHYNRSVKGSLAREQNDIRPAIGQLYHKKDSLRREIIKRDAALFREIVKTDSLLSAKQEEFDNVYSDKNVKQKKSSIYDFMWKYPVIHLRIIFLPSLFYTLVICLVMSLILYKLMRPILAKRFTWLNPET